jgi:hypothetical protein
MVIDVVAGVTIAGQEMTFVELKIGVKSDGVGVINDFSRWCLLKTIFSLFLDI